MRSAGSSSHRLLHTNVYDDGTNRLTRSTDEKDTAPTPVADVNYTYDDAGDLTKIADTPAGQTPDTQCFTYDMQRLKQAWTATDDCATEPTKDNAPSIIGGPAPYWQSFGYDAVGDRKSAVAHDITGDTAKDVSQTYTYPAADQPHPHSLTSVNTTGGAQDGETDSFTYDDDGNTKSRQLGAADSGQDFTWDLEGQLSSVTKDGQTTSFVYDADGNRLIQHASDANTLYVAGEEVRLATTPGATPVCTRYYSFGGQTIASRTTAGLTWLVSDQNGISDASVTSAATPVVTHRRFTPFGQARGTQPSGWQGTRGFVGGTIDTALGGLTQLGAREYDPNTGRFLSVDPVFDDSDPQSWNGYAYADNDPTTKSDPSGSHIPTCQTRGECGAPSSLDDTRKSDPSPPPPRHHCGWTCSVGNFWDKHKAVIVNVTVTIVVTAGCEVATGGAGSVGCLVVGGMAGNYAGYMASTPGDQQSLGGIMTATAVGALQGAASWGLGKAAGALLGKIGTTVGGRVAAKLATKAGSKAENALAKAATGGEDAAEAGAGRAAAKAAPHESPNEPVDAPSGGGGCNSFVPGTQVLMAGGKTKKIEDVKVGDKVIATDPATGKTRLEPVIASFGGTTYKKLVQIVVSADDHKVGVITATEHHKFWDQTTRTWTRADQLTSGVKLRTINGKSARVITINFHRGHPVVRDLTVARLHTFYVAAGTTPVLVHNASCPRVFAVGSSGQAAALPVHEIDSALYPGVADNFGNALDNGASPIVTRLTGRANIRANRNAAQAGQPRPGTLASGMSWEEFPFASTVEGGAGATLRLIPRAENVAHGRDSLSAVPA